MRKNLQTARKNKGITQQQMADAIGITLRYYKMLETGKRIGTVQLWDSIEDITGTNQRKLREIEDSYPVQANSP